MSHAAGPTPRLPFALPSLACCGALTGARRDVLLVDAPRPGSDGPSGACAGAVEAGGAAVAALRRCTERVRLAAAPAAAAPGPAAAAAAAAAEADASARPGSGQDPGGGTPRAEPTAGDGGVDWQAAAAAGMAAAAQAAPAAAFAAASALAEATGLMAASRAPAPEPAAQKPAAAPALPAGSEPGSASPDAPPAKRQRGDGGGPAPPDPADPGARTAQDASAHAAAAVPTEGGAEPGGGGGGARVGAALEGLADALARGRGRVGAVHLALHADEAGAVAAWHAQLEAVAEPSAPHNMPHDVLGLSVACPCRRLPYRGLGPVGGAACAMPSADRPALGARRGRGGPGARAGRRPGRDEPGGALRGRRGTAGRGPEHARAAGRADAGASRAQLPEAAAARSELAQPSWPSFVQPGSFQPVGRADSCVPEAQNRTLGRYLLQGMMQRELHPSAGHVTCVLQSSHPEYRYGCGVTSSL